MMRQELNKLYEDMTDILCTVSGTSNNWTDEETEMYETMASLREYMEDLGYGN